MARSHPTRAGGCIDVAFGPANTAIPYLTSTSSTTDDPLVWTVDFSVGSITTIEKDSGFSRARAVRDAGL